MCGITFRRRIEKGAEKMNIDLNSYDLKLAINDYIRKKGVNAIVTQISYIDRYGDIAFVSEAVILVEEEVSE